MVEPLGIVPFIPAGSDFAASRSLFLTLGARELWAGAGYVGFQWGGAKFILQDFNDPHFAGNLMLKIEVEDLDAWWTAVERLRLPERFAGFRIKPPTVFPWGREVHFIDLAGVCWQVRKP
jgi:hypothetical protein